MIQKIRKIWKDKREILQGIYNTFLNHKNKSKIEKISSERLKICRSNKCGKYDEFGKSEKVFIKGSEACSICGCNLKFLTSSQDSVCSLREIGQQPLWDKKNI